MSNWIEARAQEFADAQRHLRGLSITVSLRCRESVLPEYYISGRRGFFLSSDVVDYSNQLKARHERAARRAAGALMTVAS